MSNTTLLTRWPSFFFGIAGCIMSGKRACIHGKCSLPIPVSFLVSFHAGRSSYVESFTTERVSHDADSRDFTWGAQKGFVSRHQAE